MRAPILSITALATLSAAGCTQVPHGARVPRGAYRALSVGAGEATVSTRQELGTTTRSASAPAAQLTLGWGWQPDRVLTYLTIPLTSGLSHLMAEQDEDDEVLIRVATLAGASAGAYKELGPAGGALALGIGAMVSLGPPQMQLYAMAGLEVGDAELSIGARAGNAKSLVTEWSTTTGGFASARVPLGGNRVGVWIDGWFASRNDYDFDEASRSLDQVLLAGVLVETR